MKKFIQKEKNNRLLVLKSEDTQLILKSISRNTNFINICKWNTLLQLTSLIKKKYKIRLVCRCILTGRKGKSTYLYKFSRLTFLRLIRNGSISGLKKSVW